jgi:hypothetical protein
MALTVITSTGIANNQSYTFGSVNVTGTLVVAGQSVTGGGSSSNQNITLNSTNVTSNISVNTGYSGVSVGPLSIANGVTITIASGQKWVVL